MCRHLSHLSLMISFLILSTCLILLLLREVRGSLSEMYCPLRVPWPFQPSLIDPFWGKHIVRVFAHGIPTCTFLSEKQFLNARSRLLCPIGLDRDGLPLVPHRQA